MIEVVPHFVPIVNDIGWVACGYKSSNLPLGFTPCKRSLEVPNEGGTLSKS